MSTGEAIIDACFEASPNVRYVAAYLHRTLALRSRADLQLLGSNESDRYEEIIVNPTLLTLLTQRGNIDCGGLRHVVVSYGNFDAYILPVPGGHVTVSFEQGIDIQPEIARIGRLIEAMASPAHA
ncbi:hypothetical protein [Lysobacter terrae]